MLRVPTVPEHQMPKSAQPPAPAAASAIPGLAVAPPEPDPSGRWFQAAADAVRDLQAWKAATAVWEEDYTAARSGPDARSAAEDARAFHEAQFEPLRQKYAGNPILADYLRTEGSAIANRGIGRMNAHANLENERFVESVLAEEEQELRALMTSPWSTDADRKEAFSLYAHKAENWRRSRGETPEAIKTWKKDFHDSLVSDGLQARFDRILDQDPDAALRLIRLARGETPPDGRSAALKATETMAPGAAVSAAGGENAAASDDALTKQLRGMAPEYARFLPPEQLQLMRNRAEAAKWDRLRLNEEHAGVIHADVEAAVFRAVDGGDLAPVRGMEEKLTALGRPEEAREATAMREVMSLAQPYLAASRFEPFDRQRAGVREFFARPDTGASGREAASGAEPPAGGETAAGKETAASKVLAIVDRGLAERESRFMRDPAGYASGHPLLGREGMSAEDFRKQEGITPEEHIARSLQLQERLAGKTAGIVPRVLPEARAAEIKDQYEGLAAPREKAELARTLAAEAGKYATRLLAEAGLPMGVTAFAQVLPGLSVSESARLTQAASLAPAGDRESADDRKSAGSRSTAGDWKSSGDQSPAGKAPLEAADLPDARNEEIGRRVAESPMVQALRVAENAMAGTEADADSAKPSPAANDIVRTLERFVTIGGNLEDLERRVACSVNAELAGMQLPQGGDTAAAWARGLSLGTRDVVEGLIAPFDILTGPMNYINGKFGGDPQYFRRFGPFLADALGLARPETPGETLQSAIQQGLVSLPLLWWGGSVMMTRQSVTAVPTLAQATGRMLAGNPKADVAGTVGAATAGTLAQQHGAGPFGTIAAAVAGAMAGGRIGAGGKAAPGGAAARAEGSAAAKGAAAAEDAALGAAKGEAKAANGMAQAWRKNIETSAVSEKLAAQLAELPQGGNFPHNPYNSGKGTLTLEPGASLSGMEQRAAQAFVDRGYKVTRLAERGGKSVYTADLHIDGLGNVEVYSPDNLAIDKLVRNFEKKRQQSSMFLIQGDISLADMRKISDRIFNKPTCQHMTFIFFEPGTGNMLTFKMP